ncbi:MAG: hypothetical protein LWY06_20305 [Firmicutes bacterium]|nr:hypothetical protein [Bacillota bacterium]
MNIDEKDSFKITFRFLHGIVFSLALFILFFSPESYFQMFFNSAGKLSLIFSFLIIPGSLAFLFIFRMEEKQKVNLAEHPETSGENQISPDDSGETVKLHTINGIDEALTKKTEPFLVPEIPSLIRGVVYSLLLLLAVVVFRLVFPVHENILQFVLRFFLAFSVITVSIMFFSDFLPLIIEEQKQISFMGGQLLFISLSGLAVVIIGESADSVRYAALNYLTGATIIFLSILLLRCKDFYEQAKSRSYSFANGMITGMFLMWILPGKLSAMPGEFFSSSVKLYAFTNSADIIGNIILIAIIFHPVFEFYSALSKGIALYRQRQEDEAKLMMELEKEESEEEEIYKNMRKQKRKNKKS